MTDWKRYARPWADKLAHRLAHRISQHMGDEPSTDRAYFLAALEMQRRLASSEPAFATADLRPFELRVSSQHGEDGILAEILRRTGTSGDPHFVEFGIGRGVEGNCVLLADMLGWHGVFIEIDPGHHELLSKKYRWNPKVQTLREMVTPQNVEQLFAAAGVPTELDVLSIDVNGLDYWIWRGVNRFQPRVVVIEYNAVLSPDERLTVPEDFESWDRSDYFGASLGALKALGAAKGYRLVHTDLAGINAFFVRADLPGEWPEPVPVSGPNYFIRGWVHPPDEQPRPYQADPPV
jgi:hypothetical protein